MGWTVVNISPKQLALPTLQLLQQYCKLCKPGYEWSSDGKKFKVIDSKGRGRCYGSLIECVNADGESVRYALMVLAEKNKTDSTIAYKEISEFEGPAYYTFPQSLFRRLSPLEDIQQVLGERNTKYAEQWRERVRQEQMLSELESGTHIQFETPVHFRVKNAEGDIVRVGVTDFKIIEVKRKYLECWPLGLDEDTPRFIAKVERALLVENNWTYV